MAILQFAVKDVIKKIIDLILFGLIKIAGIFSLDKIKNYRKKKTNKIIISKVEYIIKNMLETNKKKYSMSDLEKLNSMNSDIIIIDYDKDEDNISQTHIVEEVDSIIKKIIDKDDFIIVED